MTIRLKVSYKSAESVLSEFTRSVGKGSVALESRKDVPVGTRFIFELHASDVAEALEVYGEVMSVTQVSEAKYLLNIRYDPSHDRKGLDSILQRIFEAHQFEKVRKFPRLPIHLRATEDAPYSPSYLVRDISRGGMGMEVESPKKPDSISLSAPVLLEVWLSLGTLALHGEVVWLTTPPEDRAINPAFGVSFGKLRPDTSERLEQILSLQGLPPPPWKARLSFGLDAISRMP